MKVIRNLDNENRVHGFSVSNTFLTRWGALQIVKRIPGVEVLERPRLLGDWTFCRFTLDGIEFSIDEPFGDNSMFDVTAERADSPAIERVAQVFESHKFDYLSIALWFLMVTALVFGLKDFFS